MLVNKRLSAPDYRTQTLASMMAKSHGKTAQCTVQASDADMPARSKTATDCTSHCSMALQSLIDKSASSAVPLLPKSTILHDL